MSIPNDLLTNMAQIRKLYTLMLSPLGEQYDLAQIEIHILLFLKNNPEFNTARDIEKYRGLAKSNISNALERLRKRRLLKVQKDPENRRINRIYLEEEGDVLARILQKRQAEFFTILLQDIPEDVCRAVQTFFLQTQHNVEAALSCPAGQLSSDSQAPQ